MSEETSIVINTYEWAEPNCPVCKDHVHTPIMRRPSSIYTGEEQKNLCVYHFLEWMSSLKQFGLVPEPAKPEEKKAK